MKEIKLFALLMQVVFITLKLCSVIGWSWWIVLSPMIAFASWFAFRCVFTIWYGIYRY